MERKVFSHTNLLSIFFNFVRCDEIVAYIVCAIHTSHVPALGDTKIAFYFISSLRYAAIFKSNLSVHCCSNVVFSCKK